MPLMLNGCRAKDSCGVGTTELYDVAAVDAAMNELVLVIGPR
jgi:hypothetical protein